MQDRFIEVAAICNLPWDKAAGKEEQNFTKMPKVRYHYSGAIGVQANCVCQMMVAIAIGDEVYFASSIKASNPNLLLTHKNGPLATALTQCQMEFAPGQSPASADKAHRADGNCAEIIASALHFAVHQKLWKDRTDADKTLNVRAVAFGGANIKKPNIRSPCDPRDTRIGCEQWIVSQGIEPLHAPLLVPEKVTREPSVLKSLPALSDGFRSIDRDSSSGSSGSGSPM